MGPQDDVKMDAHQAPRNNLPNENGRDGGVVLPFIRIVQTKERRLGQISISSQAQRQLRVASVSPRAGLHPGKDDHSEHPPKHQEEPKVGLRALLSFRPERMVPLRTLLPQSPEGDARDGQHHSHSAGTSAIVSHFLKVLPAQFYDVQMHLPRVATGGSQAETLLGKSQSSSAGQPSQSPRERRIVIRGILLIIS